jgi:DNA-binding NarL/FixJ family response regulator
VRQAGVSTGRRRQEQRRCEDDRKQETSHAFHAEAVGRPVLPPQQVILGGGTGGTKGEAGLTLTLRPADEDIHAGPRLGPPMPPHAPITVVLARFDDLFAGGLRELIESDTSLVIVAADVEHRRIPVVLRAHLPNVAILNIDGLSKLAEVREISDSYPATRLVLIGGDPAPVECAQLLAFGASACLGRDIQSRDVINAIHLASRGLQVIPRAVTGSGGSLAARGGLLSRREAEVLPLLQQGHSNAQIALALQVGVETVRTHARNIYRKLGVSSRRELATSIAPASEPEPVRPEHSPRHRAAAPLGRPRRARGIRHN